MIPRLFQEFQNMSTLETKTSATAGKRVNFILSDRAYAELVDLSKKNRRSMTELVRLGLGLVKIALEAADRGQRLVVTTSDGQPIKEVVLPGS